MPCDASGTCKKTPGFTPFLVKPGNEAAPPVPYIRCADILGYGRPGYKSNVVLRVWHVNSACGGLRQVHVSTGRAQNLTAEQPETPNN